MSEPTPGPMGASSHQHLYTARRDPDSDPPMIGMPVLAEWHPDQFLPAFRTYPDGWAELRTDGRLIPRCAPLAWAEYPRTAPTAGPIAAAPDLYEALEALVTVSTTPDNRQRPNQWNEAWHAARAALRKARGET